MVLGLLATGLTAGLTAGCSSLPAGVPAHYSFSWADGWNYAVQYPNQDINGFDQARSWCNEQEQPNIPGGDDPTQWVYGCASGYAEDATAQIGR